MKTMGMLSWLTVGVFSACGGLDETEKTSCEGKGDCLGGKYCINNLCTASDPRCESLCAYEPPTVEGAFDVCSLQSLEQCKQLCMARIEDTSSLCGNCLLEDACLDLPNNQYTGTLTGCSETECTLDFQNPSCSCDCSGDNNITLPCFFEIGNQVQYETCLKEVIGVLRLCLPNSTECDMIDGESHEVVCSYQKDNSAEEAACLAKLWPRKEVECTDLDFRPIAECAEFCTGQ